MSLPRGNRWRRSYDRSEDFWYLHYMRIDFLPDNEAGLKRLDSGHRPTGKVRDFYNEDKFR